MRIYFYPVLILSMFLSLSCDKNEMEPGRESSPVLYTKFNIGSEKYEYYAGVDPYLGKSTLLIDQDLRAYEFSICDYLDDSIQYFIVNFVNHSKPFGDLAGDVTKTFTEGDYDFSYSVPPVSNPFQLSTATLSWVNENGEYFTSYFYQQDSKFEITNVEANLDDEDFQYYLVSANFDCVLKKPASQDTVYIQNGETRFIVELQ